MRIGTEQEKVRQGVISYKLEFKIGECMLINFEFLILILNFESTDSMSTRSVVSV